MACARRTKLPRLWLADGQTERLSGTITLTTSPHFIKPQACDLSSPVGGYHSSDTAVRSHDPRLGDDIVVENRAALTETEA
jgi:hypothetical protein